MTGKLTVGADGRLRGPLKIDHNVPWPVPNGSWGSGKIQGLVMHTMVGNLPGTIAVFNNPSYQASAHFGVAQDGSCHQFGPIGKGWIAWAEEAGNAAWYSCEFADDADTRNPLTDAQITTGAQLLECLSNYAGFPLEVTDDVHGKGLGTHVMGGSAWGGHTCPGPGPRAMQRYEIVKLAKKIRAGEAPVPKAGPVTQWHTTGGALSLAGLAAQYKTAPATIIRLTADRFPDGFPQSVADYLNGVFRGSVKITDPMPAGLSLILPA